MPETRFEELRRELAVRARSTRYVVRLASLAVLLLGPSVGESGILVVAPHPDDDIISAAGVINRAVGREEVTVVYMTNGDVNGTASGYLRQNEAVTAQVQHLGTEEDNLIFLGYPDAHLLDIFKNYPKATDQYITPFGQGVTYGKRGLGRKDYHSFRFGSPAAYNLANIVDDLATILSTYRPAHIYTPSEFDQHNDHATTYRALRNALDQVHAADAAYSPVIHKTIIWCTQSDLWPEPVNPMAYLTPPPGLAQTSLRWEERESLDVPLPMQSPNLLVNPKYLAIQVHASQVGGSGGFITRFAHKDEIFWSENPFGGNQPPVAEAGHIVFGQPGQFAQLDGAASRDPEGASLSYQWAQRAGSSVVLLNGATASPGFVIPVMATASDTWSFQLTVSDGELSSASDMVHVFAGTSSLNIAPLATVSASSQNTGTGQLAIKAVDGVADGYPGDSTREWATAGQRAGAWIRLVWTTAYTVDRVVLYDRPNSNDQVLSGTLTFSDGSTVAVGALSNGGAGVTLSFTPREVTSVTFTVNSVSTTTVDVGLSELQVYGGSTPLPNLPPVLTSPGNQSGTVGVAVSVAVAASDADGDPLTYSASGLPAGLAINTSTGRISGTPTAAGKSTATVAVSDGRGGSDTDNFTWTVVPAPPVNNPPVLSSPGNQSGTVGVAVSLVVAASDADGDPLTYSATGLPAGLAINTSTGRISGTPTAAGTSTVTVAVSDGRGGSDTDDFTWTVVPAANAPVDGGGGGGSFGWPGALLIGLGGLFLRRRQRAPRSLDVMQSRPILKSEKDLSAEQEPPQEHGNANFTKGDQRFTETRCDVRIKKRLDVTSEQSGGHATIVQKVFGEVQRQRIHPDPDKRLTPELEFEHIHDEIEQPEKDRAVTSSYQHIRRRPDILDDGELHAPSESNCHGNDPNSDQPSYFAPVIRVRVQQEESRQYAEQAGRDCRQGAEQPLRIPCPIQFLAGQVFLVEVVGEVKPGFECASQSVRAGEIELVHALGLQVKAD